MPQYSRAELLAAVRKDHPQLANVPDNDLFRAIAVDHPDLAKGISELQDPNAQPERQPKGVLASIGEGLWNVTTPIHSPVQTAKAIGSEIKTIATEPSTLLQRAKDAMAQGRAHGDTGIGPYVHGAIGAVPFVGGQINELMDQSTYDLPGAVAKTAVEVGLPTAAARAVPKINAATSPERLMSLAAKAKELRAGVGEALLDTGKGAMDLSPRRVLTSGGQAAAGAGGGIVAPALEAAARFRSRKDVAPTVPAKPAANASPTVPINLPDETFQYQGKAPLPESADIPMALPDETFQYQGKAPLPQSSEIPMNMPDETFQHQAPPMASAEPSIDFTSVLAPEDAPLIGSQPISQIEVLTAERAIAPSGNIKKAATLRNVPELLKIVPELRRVQPGPRFDNLLVNSFKRMEQNVEAVENTVPSTARVPKQQIVDGLKALEDDYISRNLPASIRTVAKVREAWEALPNEMIPWDDFVKLKRAFLKEGRSAQNAAMRKSYGVLMEASNQVSPALTAANRQYSIVRRALENANLDPGTGRRIGQVGADPVKPIVKPPTQQGKRFNMPL